VTLGTVAKILLPYGLLVKLPYGNMGTVAITELADAYKPSPLAAYSKYQLLRSATFLMCGAHSPHLQTVTKLFNLLTVVQVKQNKLFNSFEAFCDGCAAVVSLCQQLPYNMYLGTTIILVIPFRLF